MCWLVTNFHEYIQLSFLSSRSSAINLNYERFLIFEKSNSRLSIAQFCVNSMQADQKVVIQKQPEIDMN